MHLYFLIFYSFTTCIDHVSIIVSSTSSVMSIIDMQWLSESELHWFIICYWAYIFHRNEKTFRLARGGKKSSMRCVKDYVKTMSYDSMNKISHITHRQNEKLMSIFISFSSQFEIWFLKAIFILHSCVTFNTRYYLFSMRSRHPHTFMKLFEGLIWIYEFWYATLIFTLAYFAYMIPRHMKSTRFYIQHMKSVTKKILQYASML